MACLGLAEGSWGPGTEDAQGGSCQKAGWVGEGKKGYTPPHRMWCLKVAFYLYFLKDQRHNCEGGGISYMSARSPDGRYLDEQCAVKSSREAQPHTPVISHPEQGIWGTKFSQKSSWIARMTRLNDDILRHATKSVSVTAGGGTTQTRGHRIR